MLINKKKSMKIIAVLIFGLLFLSNITGVITTTTSSESSDEIDGDIDALLDTEFPIYDDTPIIDTGVEPIDFTGEDVIEPDNYDRNAIAWRPIEESLKNIQFNAEAAGASIATASYDTITGVETIIEPQFLPSPESMPELSVVEPYAGLLAGTNTAEAVIGGDGRVVYNNQVFPGRTIVKLYISASDGSNWVGSGAIVDNFHVLTAGHCAFLPDNGGWAASIEIVPGMDTSDNPSDPYGHAWTVGMRSYTGWTISESSQHDWALLTLDRNVGIYTGWMGRTMAGETSSMYDGIMNVAGYPTDLSGGNRLYMDSDWGDGATFNNHFYWADTAQGMSGGPVWRDVSGYLYIMTVHAYGRGGVLSNYGTRLNADKYNRLFDWLGEDSAPTDKADLVDRGSAFDSVSAGPWQADVTSVTITNGIRNVGTAASGNYYVHYYASTNDYISQYDYYIGTSTVESTGNFPSSAQYDTATFTGILPDDIPKGTYYIGWIIDNDDDVDEFDETNNKAVFASQRFIDGAPPPRSYIEVRVRDSVTYAYMQSVNVKTYVSGTSSLIDTGYTDSNGFYNVTNLADGTYDVHVSYVGYKAEMQVDIIHNLAKGFDDDYLNFYLDEYGPDTSWIEINVKDSDTSNPISSAYVQIINKSSGLVIDTGYTNGAGFYNATGLFIGWYEVTVSRAGYKDQIKQNYINWNHDDDYLYFYLEKMPINSGYIEVRTFNETGAPLSGVLVKAYNNSGLTLVSSGYTNINGTYNITGLVIGWYEVNVTYSGWQEQSKSDYINWNGDDDYLSFWMVPNPPASGYIDITVYDSVSYLPISWAIVEVTNQSSGLVIQTGYTDTSGFYKVVNLTIGWYTIEITRVGYHAQSKQDYINWAGDDDYLTFYMVEMPPDSGYIEVLVKDDDTLAPIQSVLVSCYYNNGTFFSSGYTDSSGFYNITGLYIGWYEVVVSHTSYGGDSRYNYINWNGDDDYQTFYLVLKPPGWIEVTVLDMYNYNPIPDVYVRCYNNTSGELVDEGYTDVDGFYNITGLLLGWWQVNVSHPAFEMGSMLDYINWRGDDDYLTFYLDTKFEPFTGMVAIFRDTYPWNLNVTEPILEDNGLTYTIFNSSDFGSVDLSPYQKVIIVSEQYTSFYDKLMGNETWFESYVSNGGILLFLGADHGSQHFGTWDGNLLFGLNYTFIARQLVDIDMPSHPLLLTPSLIEDDELDNWLYSTHGYFESIPLNSKVLLVENITQEPVLVEFKLGNGFILATVQPLEWNHNKNYTRILENLILYDPAFYDNSINVTSPISSEYWEANSMHTITWDSTGSITNVKIDLYENGVFVMELAGSTPNDGSFSWTVPIGLNDSVLYQIRVSDTEYAATEDYSDNFEIEDPRSITDVVPDSTTIWRVGYTYDIDWNSTGIIANVKIDLYENGVFVMELAASSPNDGSFSWTVPIGLIDSILYQIRISDVIDATMEDYSDDFEIEDPRSITVVVPDSTTSWKMGNTQNINWTSTGIIPNVKIELYASSILIMELVASTTNDGSFEWTIPDTLVNYTVYVIRISDVLDPTMYDDSDPFSIVAPPGGGIPGFDILILGGLLLGMSSYLIIRKRKKLRVN